MAQKQLEGCLHADILDKDFKLINSWDSKLINSWDALCVTEANKKSLLRFVRVRDRGIGTENFPPARFLLE